MKTGITVVLTLLVSPCLPLAALACSPSPEVWEVNHQSPTADAVEIPTDASVAFVGQNFGGHVPMSTVLSTQRLEVRGPGGEVVPGEVLLGRVETTLVWNPVSDLEPLTRYTAVLPMEAEWSFREDVLEFSFTTGSGTRDRTQEVELVGLEFETGERDIAGACGPEDIGPCGGCSPPVVDRVATFSASAHVDVPAELQATVFFARTGMGTTRAEAMAVRERLGFGVFQTVTGRNELFVLHDRRTRPLGQPPPADPRASPSTPSRRLINS
ncbi:MAG: hypothetical protein EXR76_17790 [Myxococcales bacterium]|nr:hypothetical protein [Myxococcales bacterium]